MTREPEKVFQENLLRETGAGGFLHFWGGYPDRGRASYLRRLLYRIRMILLLFAVATVLLVTTPLHAASLEDISPLNTTCGDEGWNLKYGVFYSLIKPRIEKNIMILQNEMGAINDAYDTTANLVDIATGTLSLVGMFGAKTGLEIAAAGLDSGGIGLAGFEAEYGLNNVWTEITGEMIDGGSAILSTLSDPTGLSLAVYLGTKIGMMTVGSITIWDLNKTRKEFVSLAAARDVLTEYYRSCGDFQKVSEYVSAPYPLTGCTYNGVVVDQLSCAAIQSEYYQTYGSEGDGYVQMVSDVISNTLAGSGGVNGIVRAIQDSIPPTPVINSVIVTPDLGCMGLSNKQWVTINGQSFLDTSKVVLETGAVPYEIPADRTVFINATKIDVCAGVGYASNWTAQVVNPLNSSNTYSFSVSGTTPSVSINANPSSISSGASTSLSWSSANVSSCSAAGGWGGVKSTSGSMSVSPSATTTYTLNCTGLGGNASNSVTVTVGSSTTAAPQIFLTATPLIINLGASSSLGWAATNATSCSASGGNWSGSKPVSGGEVIYPSTMTTYTLTCTGAGGSASGSVTVLVGTSTPIVNLTVSPSSITQGNSSTLKWSSAGMSSCAATGGWSGSKSLIGEQSVQPNSNTTYTLTCTGSGSGTETELVRNGGFDGTASEWIKIGGFYAGEGFYNYRTRYGYAYFSNPDGTGGNNLEGELYQTVTIPYDATVVTLTYWVAVSTTEDAGTVPYDALYVLIKDATGSQLGRVNVLSNNDAESGTYRMYTSDLTAYRGQTIRLSFIGTTDYGNPTVFRIDDVSVNAITPSSTYSNSDSVTVTVMRPAAPAISFSASPDSITAGQFSTLRWNASNATGCTAGSGWSGSKSTSGSMAIYPSQNTTYSITCSGSGGSVTGNATVMVIPPAPTLSMSVTPSNIVAGEASRLSWNTTNATRCTAYGGWGDDGLKPVGGSQLVYPSSTTSYVLSCEGTAGSVVRDVSVSVTPHTLIITNWTSGSPNPVDSGNIVNLSATATDSLQSHSVSYSWSAQCIGLGSSGSFSNPNVQNPTWTAPQNTTGTQQNCSISVRASDGSGGLEQVAVYIQKVGNDIVLTNDTDSDGLPDDWETTSFGNLAIADSTTDSDNDGLLDVDEYRYGTNPNNTDTDGDGFSDGDEVRYGSNPILSIDTLDSHRPYTPVMLPVSDEATLREQVFDVENFADPDQAQSDYLTASRWEISTDQNFTNGNSIFSKILERNTDDSEVDYRRFLLPDSLLVKATDYWVRTRHQDSAGLWSAWSAPVAFSTVATDPNDTDDDDIDDSYQVTGYTDTDGNSIDDSVEGIRTLYDAKGGATVGIRTGSGTLGSLTAVSNSDIPTGQMPTDPMSYGLFSFRIDGLPVDAVNPATADVTFYFPEPLPSGTKWYKYDSVSGTMTDFTTNVAFSGNHAIVTLTDGGAGDADGVINGVIVDPGGPVLPVANSTVDEDNNASAASDSGGDSSIGCSIRRQDSSVDPVLPLLVIWSLFYLMRCRRGTHINQKDK